MEMPRKIPFQKPVHSALATEAADGLNHQLLQGQPPQPQRGQPELPLLPSRGPLGVQCCPQSAPGVPASRFDFFCPILLLVLSLDPQTLSQLLLLEHSAFNNQDARFSAGQQCPDTKVCQHRYMNRFFIAPKTFALLGRTSW